MKQALDRFIRSLAERELSGAAPETLHDLGSFVDWLVERLGYTVHLRAFKYAGLERTKSAGRLQLGVDMLATRPDAEGQVNLYRFVLKAGGITKADWGRSGEEGNILHDIRLAADRNADRDHQDFVLGTTAPHATVVVAVHNGDFDSEALGGNRAQLKGELAKRGIQLEWWDAGELGRLAEPLLAKGPDGEDGGDAGLFPPAVRPFARLAIDSLRRDWRAFDFRAVDEYLEARLPLGRAVRRVGAQELLDAGAPIDPLHLVRRAAEIPLFTAMLIAESRVTGHSSTVPALDVLERCICRLAEHASRIDSSKKAHLERLFATLRALLQQYVELALTLKERLSALRGIEYGIAIATLSEPIDYPLRCLRLLGYMAVAGLTCLNAGNDADALAFAEVIASTWATNAAACESPVTDDQVIELTAVWLLLLKTGLSARVGEMTTSLVNRLLARRHLRLPLPALYQRASVPISERDLRVLVTAHAFGAHASSRFIDDASTLLSVATYLACRHGSLSTEIVKMLRRGEQNERGDPVVPRCSFQLWRPPSDAAGEWYAHEIAYRGIAHQFQSPEERDDFVREFEAQAVSPEESFGQGTGLQVIDLIAWKIWRTLPDAGLIVASSRLCRQ